MCDIPFIETNRDGLIRALRKYARKRELRFEVDKTKGKGAHYKVVVGSNWTTVQSDLTPGRIERILKQLEIDPAAI